MTAVLIPFVCAPAAAHSSTLLLLLLLLVVHYLCAQFYEEIHTPGHDAPFKVRGPNYLQDHVKVPPGQPMFELLGMEAVNTGSADPMPHISRFLPCVRYVYGVCVDVCLCVFEERGGRKSRGVQLEGREEGDGGENAPLGVVGQTTCNRRLMAVFVPC